MMAYGGLFLGFYIVQILVLSINAEFLSGQRFHFQRHSELTSPLSGRSKQSPKYREASLRASLYLP